MILCLLGPPEASLIDVCFEHEIDLSHRSPSLVHLPVARNSLVRLRERESSAEEVDVVVTSTLGPPHQDLLLG